MARPGVNRSDVRRRCFIKVCMEDPRLAGERLVDDGERLVALHHGDGGQPKLGAELVCRDKHRPGRRRTTRGRLRKCRRQCRVEGHVAFDLLGQLMDMAVQHGDRAEPLEQVERLRAVLGTPAPFLVDDLERDMRKHDDRRAVRLAL